MLKPSKAYSTWAVSTYNGARTHTLWGRSETCEGQALDSCLWATLMVATIKNYIWFILGLTLQRHKVTAWAPIIPPIL